MKIKAADAEAQTSRQHVLDSLQFLRVNDICRLLRISKPTFWRLRRTHDFPEPTRLTDRVIAWGKREVEEWLLTRHSGGRAKSSRISKYASAGLATRLATNEIRDARK